MREGKQERLGNGEFHATLVVEALLRTAGQITASSFARNREPSCDRHTPSDSVIPPGVLSRLSRTDAGFA